MRKWIKKFVSLFIGLLLLFSSTTAIAGDGDEFVPEDPNARGGNDELLYQGIPIAPPHDKATPVPPQYLDKRSRGGPPARDGDTLVDALAVSGTINQTTTVYYGPSSSYVARETLYAGKAVSVIEKEGSYYLIEYSGSGGLVRGYVPNTAVTCNCGTVPWANNNINQFGLNISGSTATVYGGPGTTTYVSIGSVSNREIVTVKKTDSSSWYHIEYWTSSGNKRGYIQTSKTNVPWLTYRYVQPIYSGTRTNDFGTHQGIDIGVSSGTPVYAITGGTAKFRTAYEVIDNVRYAVSYGNFVELYFGSNKAYYAHLSSFTSPYVAANYPNTNPPRGYT